MIIIMTITLHLLDTEEKKDKFIEKYLNQSISTEVKEIEGFKYIVIK